MTKQKQGELLNTQNNVEETHRETSSPLVNEEIPNTPFRIHGIENEWFITLGDYRITKNFLTEEEALAHLEVSMWNVILQMIGTALDRFDQKQWQKTLDTTTQEDLNRSQNIKLQDEAFDK